MWWLKQRSTEAGSGMFSPLEEERQAFQAERTSEKPRSMHMLSMFEKPQRGLCPKAGCMKGGW